MKYIQFRSYTSIYNAKWKCQYFHLMGHFTKTIVRMRIKWPITIIVLYEGDF